jgi:hypothetical protein
MAERVILTADPGMVLTNGTDYGRVVWLAEGADPAAYYQITEAEYNARIEGEQAEAADYEAALAKLGVE